MDTNEYKRQNYQFYHLKKNLVSLRQEQGLKQEDLAKILKKQKSDISYFENNDSLSYELLMFEEYAKALGYEVEINLVPIEFSTRAKKLS